MDWGARWDKILHDIWNNKARSLLVISTLAIGIAVIGMINNTVRLMKRDLYGGYAKTNPASVDIYVSPFPEELAVSVEALREVEHAEARRIVSAYISSGSNESHPLKIISLPDFNDIQVNRFSLDEGKGIPGLREILIERNTAQNLDISLGENLHVEMENGNRFELSVAGIIHDMSTEHFSISGNALGYINPATLEWLGEQPGYNQIRLTVLDQKSDRDHVLRVASLARDRVIETSGYRVLGISIHSSAGIPGEFWAKQQIDGVLLVLQIMSILAIILSAGLVVNTISAVIVQQARQIGVMRAVGASRRQIIILYLGYVFILSLFGLLIALPVGMAGSAALGSVAASFMNYQMGSVDLPPSIVILQAALALIMPVGVAIFPILKGTRASVYETIYQYGLISGENKRGWFEQQLVRVRNFHPPIMLSLRNTFRNKSRLSFTLITLTIAGAMFMAVFSSYNTLQSQVKELARYIQFDASINTPGGVSRQTAEREALRIPEIQVAEGWLLESGYIVHSDGQEGDQIEFVGLPENSRTIEPRIITGRWLLPTDKNQVVINEDLLSKDKNIRVGDQIEVKIDGLTRELEVVGIASKHMIGSRIYMNDSQLARISGRYNQVDTVRVLATPDGLGNPNEQNMISMQLEKRFEDAQLSESSSKTRQEIFSALSNSFNILLMILMLVALILAVIGGLGLTGTMGLNVLERTREIGVLRAVGASHLSVKQVVVVEGVVVAMMSWIVSAVISYPIGRILAEALIRTAFGTAASFDYSHAGLLVWFFIVVLIGIFSSLAPARDAARLTVREVLSYE